MATKDHMTADCCTRLPYDKILTDITDYVYKYDITSSKALQRARIALLDSLGCALETLKESSEARNLLGPAVPRSYQPDGFKLPGTAFQLDPVKGAFDFGTLIRYLDHNDAFPGAEWGHPSDNIGAILAVADWLSRNALYNNSPPLTMKTVLVAIIKAYEIQGCFQIRNAFNRVGLDQTILVRVASTAVVCHLLGCTEDQTLSGLSHAFVDAGPLRIYRQSPNAGPRKGWGAGDACMRAVHLALLAKKDQPGVPSVLTDSKWGLYTSLLHGKEFQLPRPFKTWVIETSFFKIHAAEGHAASAVEAALTLAHHLRTRDHPLNLPIEQGIQHIRVRTQKPAMIIINKQGTLHNAADRDHCMQYMIAVVLLKGSMITSADYDDESPWATDARVDALRAKICMVEDEQLTADYYNAEKRTGANALLVTLADGSKLDEVLVEYPTGHPWRDDTPELVKDKFEANMKGWFEEEQLADVIKYFSMDIESLMSTEVHAFVDAFATTEKFETLAKTEHDRRTAANLPHSEGSCASSVETVSAVGWKDSAAMTISNNNPFISIKSDGDSTGFTNGSKDNMMAREALQEHLNKETTDDNPKEKRVPVWIAEQTAVKQYLHQKPPDSLIVDGNISIFHGNNEPDGEVYLTAFSAGKSPYPSPHVSHGLRYYQACVKHIAETFGVSRVWILASESLAKHTSHLPRLHAAIDGRLGEDSVLGITRGVKPHSSYSDILRIANEARARNVQLIVTIGGGSLTDAAKIVSLAIANDATTVDELETLSFDSPTFCHIRPATIPIICIPTTLSAAEYTPMAGATNSLTHHKHSFQHPSMGPRIIILDPELSITTPLRVWLSTGIRAVDHCIEALCAIEASGGSAAERGLRRLLPNLLITKNDPGNLEARLSCQLGAKDAISAPLNMAPMGASHGIGHQLGPLGVGYGETSCILLPAVCKYNKPVNAEKQQLVLDILWSEDVVVRVLNKAGLKKETADLGDALDVVIRELGIPRTLKEVGVGPDKFEKLAVVSCKDRWCKTNPIPLTETEEVMKILNTCSGWDEQTFKNYNKDEAKEYSSGRPSYHKNLIRVILGHHASTGGMFGTLLDVGCGPGNSTRPLATRFNIAYGIDPSEEMVKTAKGLSAGSPEMETYSGSPVQFTVGKAEELRFDGKEIKVDLLTAGTAAHLFDMARFWRSAAKILNPGGTVALWNSSGTVVCHPSTPNASRVQGLISRLEHEYLAPYEWPENILSRTLYDSLLMPWNMTPPIEEFKETRSKKHVWDRDREPSSGDEFFLGNQHVTVAQLMKVYETTSLMARWRQANPELIGTDSDILVKTARDMREVLGGENMVIGIGCVLLLFTKE